jgi:hypothetical protein
MALMDGGVNVMESDDVQWRFLTDDHKPRFSRRCHLAQRGDCLVPTNKSCLYHLGYIEVYLDHLPTSHCCISCIPFTETYKSQREILSK